MATVKLVGHDDATPYGGNSPGQFWLTQFTAVATGNIAEVKLRTTADANVKLAIYADSGGEPGARLGFVGDTYLPAAGWHTVAISSTPVVNGTAYWLAYVSWYGYKIGYLVETGVCRYKAWTYADDLPDPAGSGFTTDTTHNIIIAGWGILVLSPSSIVQPVSYGTPEVIITSALTIQPSSIVQVVAIGAPALLYPQILLPSSIVQAIAYGTPSVSIVGVAGYIYPQSIVQQISIGSPTILKYVWHVILDGQYIAESPDINRAYIIGRDAYGNPVWGEAHDTAESGLVGERLDFTQELAIPTTAQAGDVASAVLAKMRLRGKGGVILIPPNCGQELFDVVQISDAGANQSAVTFRVVGIRFEYSPKQARYAHKLILGAP